MKSFDVTAGKTIEVGEQIYISYNMCSNCGGRANDYGTPGKCLRVSRVMYVPYVALLQILTTTVPKMARVKLTLKQNDILPSFSFLP